MQASAVIEFSTLGVGTEVEVLALGQNQKTPYIGCHGRIVEVLPMGYFKVILDDDPIPRWRNIGIQCKESELRILEDKDV